MRSFHTKISPRRQVYLALAGEVESQLRDAYDERHRSHGVTQASIAKALGINRSAINHRLRGLVNMTIETLADMVWALGYAIKVVIYDPAKVGDNAIIAEFGIPAAHQQQWKVTPLKTTPTSSTTYVRQPHKFEVEPV